MRRGGVFCFTGKQLELHGQGLALRRGLETIGLGEFDTVDTPGDQRLL